MIGHRCAFQGVAKVKDTSAGYVCGDDMSRPRNPGAPARRVCVCVCAEMPEQSYRRLTGVCWVLFCGDQSHGLPSRILRFVTAGKLFPVGAADRREIQDSNQRPARSGAQKIKQSVSLLSKPEVKISTKYFYYKSITLPLYKKNVKTHIRGGKRRNNHLQSYAKKSVVVKSRVSFIHG